MAGDSSSGNVSRVFPGTGAVFWAAVGGAPDAPGKRECPGAVALETAAGGFILGLTAATSVAAASAGAVPRGVGPPVAGARAMGFVPAPAVVTAAVL